MSEPADADRGWVPRPDPTLLTTEQLLREIAVLKELVESKLENARSERGMLATKMEGHFLIDQERFNKIEERFQLIEARRLEQKVDTQAALDAALAAQKESLVSLTDLLRTTSDALGSKLDDLKERVGRSEASGEGANQQRQRGLEGANLWIAVAAVIVALVVGYFVTSHRSTIIVRDPVRTTTQTVTTQTP